MVIGSGSWTRELLASGTFWAVGMALGFTVVRRFLVVGATGSTWPAFSSTPSSVSELSPLHPRVDRLVGKVGTGAATAAVDRSVLFVAGGASVCSEALRFGGILS